MNRPKMKKHTSLKTREKRFKRYVQLFWMKPDKAEWTNAEKMEANTLRFQAENVEIRYMEMLRMNGAKIVRGVPSVPIAPRGAWNGARTVSSAVKGALKLREKFTSLTHAKNVLKAQGKLPELANDPERYIRLSHELTLAFPAKGTQKALDKAIADGKPLRALLTIARGQAGIREALADYKRTKRACSKR